VATNTRLDTTFTPDLTLERFAQPFLASGLKGAGRRRRSGDAVAHAKRTVALARHRAGL